MIVELDRIQSDIRIHLEQKNAAREATLPLCRKAIRLSANAIRAIHRGEADEALSLMDQAGSCLEDSAKATEGHPDIRFAGFVHDASKEYAEARITYALIFSEALPVPADLGVEIPAYLNGMGEAIGEMRRHLLDLMRGGHLGRSEELLAAMDDIYYLLIGMDFPDAMTGGLRRTTDVARSIIERTRGDLSTTIIQEKLKAALDNSAAKR